ncbi:MAG TPA: hypothetical protein VH539_10405 [Gemmatimonadaceae bacterium]|jgi:hypothetical protein
MQILDGRYELTEVEPTARGHRRFRAVGKRGAKYECVIAADTPGLVWYNVNGPITKTVPPALVHLNPARALAKRGADSYASLRAIAREASCYAAPIWLDIARAARSLAAEDNARAWQDARGTPITFRRGA